MAGLTIGGKIPYTGTFANFSTGRVYDQIRQSSAYRESGAESDGEKEKQRLRKE